MSREAIPHLKQQGGGRIINILGQHRVSTHPQPGALGRYPAWAWWRFAKSLADEMGRMAF